MVAYKLGLSLVVRMRAAEDAPQPCLQRVQRSKTWLARHLCGHRRDGSDARLWNSAPNMLVTICTPY
jgi:hypothetical protein